MINHNKFGGRTVELFIPFEFNGKKIESIVLAPFQLGHVLLWNEGHWKTQFDLMVELAGVDAAVLRQLRYPDADRVMEAFFAVITPEIRQDIADGRVPQKAEPETEAPKVTNGSGQPIPPGVPIPPEFQPEAGFDMSEEP